MKKEKSIVELFVERRAKMNVRKAQKEDEELVDRPVIPEYTSDVPEEIELKDKDSDEIKQLINDVIDAIKDIAKLHKITVDNFINSLVELFSDPEAVEELKVEVKKSEKSKEEINEEEINEEEINEEEINEEEINEEVEE